jgi:hypothetical protein
VADRGQGGVRRVRKGSGGGRGRLCSLEGRRGVANVSRSERAQARLLIAAVVCLVGHAMYAVSAGQQYGGLARICSRFVFRGFNLLQHPC